MIIGIQGLARSGKSTIVNSIINTDRSSFSYKTYKSVKFMVSDKYKLVVLGYYPLDSLHTGANCMIKGCHVDVMDLINKYHRVKPEYNIIYEGSVLCKPELEAFLLMSKRKFMSRLFALNVSRSELAIRRHSIKDDYPQAYYEKDRESYDKMILRGVALMVRNENLTDLQINIEAIKEMLSIKPVTKLRKL